MYVLIIWAQLQIFVYLLVLSMWTKCFLLLLTVTATNFHSAKAIQGRVVGGMIANINDFKHQVSLRYKKREDRFGSGHVCGGSIISHKTILTAAHCLYTHSSGLQRLLFPDEIRIVMGSAERLKITNNTLMFDAEELYHHVKYNRASIRFDLGVVYLKGTIPKNHPTAQPISLTSKRIPERTKCTVSGWGRISETGPIPGVLLYAELEIVDFDTCDSKYSSIWGAELRKGMICANSATSGSCYGDSGGPLTCDGILAGIVSWGVKCGTTGYPGVYTDVYHFRKWILENGAVTTKSVVLVEFVTIIHVLLLILFR